MEVTFLGWEVGCDVITGGNLSSDDVLYHILVDHGSAKGRFSWDPMLVTLALVGDEATAGYDIVRGMARVDGNTGENFFTRSEAGLHCFVVKKFENTYYEEQINQIICSDTTA